MHPQPPQPPAAQPSWAAEMPALDFLPHSREAELAARVAALEGIMSVVMARLQAAEEKCDSLQRSINSSGAKAATDGAAAAASATASAGGAPAKKKRKAVTVASPALQPSAPPVAASAAPPPPRPLLPPAFPSMFDDQYDTEDVPLVTRISIPPAATALQASLKRKRSQEAGAVAEMAAASSASAAASSSSSVAAAASSPAIAAAAHAIPTLPPISTALVAAAATPITSSATIASNPVPVPTAGSYDDPSLVDVADSNRDVENIDEAPGVYRGLLALERELRAYEDERKEKHAGGGLCADAAAAALGQSKRARLEAGSSAGGSGSTSISRSIQSSLDSEKESLMYSSVHGLKLDPRTGATLVLVTPRTSSDRPPDAPRPPAQWVALSCVQGLTPALVPHALVTRLFVHQLAGVKFLLDALLGRNVHGAPTGAILADAMGLGKSLTTLAALHCYAQFQRDERAAAGFLDSVNPCFLIVCPPTVLRHWQSEILRLSGWMADAAFSGAHTDLTDDRAVAAPLNSFVFPVKVLDSTVAAEDRPALLQAWREQRGTLLIGYDLFRLITDAHGAATSSSSSAAASSSTAVPAASSAAPSTAVAPLGLDDDEDEVMDLTVSAPAATVASSASAASRDLSLYFTAPGPDVIVCDEGHKIKNMSSSITAALSSRVPTRRRILLSGYPLQNSLMELYSAVEFVRPSHLSGGHTLGAARDFERFFEKPVLKAQASEKPEERRKARRRCWLLYDLLRRESVMLRRSATLLHHQLPHPLYELVLTLRMSALQHRIYTYFLSWRKAQSGQSLLGAMDVVGFLSLLLIHPHVLRKHCQDIGAVSQAHVTNAMEEHEGDAASTGASGHHSSALLKRSFIESAFPLTSSSDVTLPAHSGKIVFLLSLLRECKRVGDRLVIFSRFLAALDFVEEVFREQNRALDAECKKPGAPADLAQLRSGDVIRWGRIDGHSSLSDRNKLIRMFGPPADRSPLEPTDDVLLMSTACGEGVNLSGANRVLLLDVAWNPNTDLQAAARVYRYGQIKACFVYRLVIEHSTEEKVFRRQIKKEELTKWTVERRAVSRSHAVGASTANLAIEDAASAVEAAADPLAIQRFFDPPPSLESWMAHRTQIRLPPVVQKDAVTQHLLRAHSNLRRAGAAATPVPPEVAAEREATQWILSAFEQHALLEDDSSAASLFGPTEAEANAAASVSSATAAAADTARAASPAAGLSTGGSNAVEPSPLVASPPAPPVASKTPVYYFGRIPAGVSLASTTAKKPAAPAEPAPAATAAAAPAASSPSIPTLPISLPARPPPPAPSAAIATPGAADASRPSTASRPAAAAAASSAAPAPKGARTAVPSSARVAIPSAASATAASLAPRHSASSLISDASHPFLKDPAAAAPAPSALSAELAASRNRLAEVAEKRQERKEQEKRMQLQQQQQQQQQHQVQQQQEQERLRLQQQQQQLQQQQQMLEQQRQRLLQQQQQQQQQRVQQWQHLPQQAQQPSHSQPLCRFGLQCTRVGCWYAHPGRVVKFDQSWQSPTHMQPQQQQQQQPSLHYQQQPQHYPQQTQPYGAASYPAAASSSQQAPAPRPAVDRRPIPQRAPPTQQRAH